MICNVTLDAANWAAFEPRLAGFLKSLPAAAPSQAQWQPTPASHFEGLTIPAQVNYVGKGANLFKLGYEARGSVDVILNYLRTTWLWERVRVQGGAYGAFCMFSNRSGVFTYLSYRDPNLLKTLDNYDGTARFLKTARLEPGGADQEHHWRNRRPGCLPAAGCKGLYLHGPLPGRR